MKNYIQIGANVGNDHFKQMMMDISDNANIYLIEANSNLLDELKVNYSDVKDKNIYIDNIAITDTEDKEIELYLFDSHGHSSLMNRKTLGYKSTLRCKSCKLEDYLIDKNITNIEVLYIDCEGLDLKILNSLDLCKYNIEKIFFEYWSHENDDLNNKFNTTNNDLNDFFEKYKNIYNIEQIVIEGMVSYKMTKLIIG
jgi:FkbM family methyltransferase